jgi:hypothetical protein
MHAFPGVSIKQYIGMKTWLAPVEFDNAKHANQAIEPRKST